MRRLPLFIALAALLLSGAAILLAALLFTKIQTDREFNVRSNCLAVNDRQDQTKARTEELIVKLPPARRAEADARVSSTYFLIEALAPKRDCEAVVREQFG